METSDVDRLFTDLQRVVGLDLAKRLTPRFTQAAAVYQTLERESIIDVEQRRAAAKHRLAALKAADKRFGRLLEPLVVVTALIREASTRTDLPDTGSAADRAAVPTSLATHGEAERMVRQVRAWRDTVGVWREDVRLDTVGTPGRKVGDRLLLAEWVALKLAREGVPLKKTADGILARVLGVVYGSCRIKAPEDLYDDVCHAIDETAHARQNLP
jgi:hypothetical protein